VYPQNFELGGKEIKGADKLYKLILDVGELGERIICAGIKEYYSKEELKGKKIIYFSNLKSRKMMGIESQGMLLAASTDKSPLGVPQSAECQDKVILLTPDTQKGTRKEIENGSRVG